MVTDIHVVEIRRLIGEWQVSCRDCKFRRATSKRRNAQAVAARHVYHNLEELARPMFSDAPLPGQVSLFEN